LFDNIIRKSILVHVIEYLIVDNMEQTRVTDDEKIHRNTRRMLAMLENQQRLLQIIMSSLYDLQQSTECGRKH